MDVHYSLPRDMDTSKPCNGDQNQGTLRLRIQNARGPLSEEEVYDRFGKVGEIRRVMPVDPRYPDERLIEYHDSRVRRFAFRSQQIQVSILTVLAWVYGRRAVARITSCKVRPWLGGGSTCDSNGTRAAC